MAFKIKEGLTINTTSVFDDSAVLQVNAPTASKWLNARTLTLAGDATGSVSIDGSQNVTLTVTVAGVGGTTEAPVFTADVTGDVYAQNGTTKVLENSAAGIGAWFQGDLRATNGSTTVLTVGDGTSTPQFEGNSNTADAWSTPRDFTVALTGDVTGTATLSVDGSANRSFSVAATIAANSVALGTDTTGNYAAAVAITAGTGLSMTGTAGEGSTFTLAGVDATTSVKGVASFATANFTVASGAVSAKDITLGSTALSLGSTSLVIAGLNQIDVNNIRITGNTISSTTGNIVLDPTGTGTVDVNTSRITNVSTPTAGTDAANKQYVDDVAQGLRALPQAQAYSSTNLAATYNNGTAGVGATLTASANGVFPTIDGVTLAQGDNVVVNGQTAKLQNGSYILTTVGTAGTPWVLTRAEFLNQAIEMEGSFEFITGGTNFANTGWVLTAGSEPVVMGTTEFTWVQFSGAGTYIAGDGLALNGVTFSVNVDNSGIEISADTLQLKNTAVTPGSYGSATAVATFTVDAKGRLTAAGSTNIAITTSQVTGFEEAVEDVIGGMLTGTQNGIAVTYTDGAGSGDGVLNFDVADFSITLTGDVTGTGTVTNLGNVSFATTIAANSVALGTDTTGDYVATLTQGTGISVTGAGTEGRAATVALSHLGIQDLVDPNADRILFWDDSAGATKFLTVGTGLTIDDVTLKGNTVISVTDTPGAGTFAETGTINTGALGTVTFASGTGIDLDIDTTNGIVRIASTAGSTFDSGQAQVNASSTAVINSFATTAFRSAKYYIQAVSGSNYQACEVMVVHNGTTVDIIEYAVVELGTPVGNISAAVSGGNVNISFANAIAATANIVIRRLGIPDYV